MAEICSICGLPKEICVCGTISKEQQKVIVTLEKRKWGKATTIIEGFDEKSVDLSRLAQKLKTLCACGGTAKNNQIILQGDHREKAKELLAKQGFHEDNIEIKSRISRTRKRR
ncbi:translation initiation factor [Candidatus Bathyarchaeota archaeon]|nr:translation initiation factor [Candidatus Bathyarchaeota archaeon]